jgi:hypothetical protein
MCVRDSRLYSKNASFSLVQLQLQIVDVTLVATTERAMFVGGVLAVLSAATGAPSASVYWVSSPTLVNETLLVAGAGTCAVD